MFVQLLIFSTHSIDLCIVQFTYIVNQKRPGISEFLVITQIKKTRKS